MEEVLLVIAHPDDEAMFFGPFLLHCRNSGRMVSLLCMSKGNRYGLGDIRSNELFACAEVFGISSDRVHIIDHPELQDGMENNWPGLIVCNIILDHLKAHPAALIVTFDEVGVSSHPNHIATFKGVEQALASTSSVDSLRVTGLKLESTNIFRKFTGVLDLFFSHFTSTVLMYNLNVFTIFKAMWCHKSQFVWYRALFILFSRYTYVNTFSGFHNKRSS